MDPQKAASDLDTSEILSRQLEELSLLRHTLLPGEVLSFVVPSSAHAVALWIRALDEFTTDPEGAVRSLLSADSRPSGFAAAECPTRDGTGHADDLSSEDVWGPQGARIRVGLEDSKRVWYEVDVPRTYPDRAFDDGSGGASVSVKGEAMGREEQARWQEIVREKMEIAWADGCE